MSRCRTTSSDRKEACSSIHDGLKLIELLQNFIVQQNEHIELLKDQLRKVEEERDVYKHQLESSKVTRQGESESDTSTKAEDVENLPACKSLTDSNIDSANSESIHDEKIAETETQEIMIELQEKQEDVVDSHDGPSHKTNQGDSVVSTEKDSNKNKDACKGLDSSVSPEKVPEPSPEKKHLSTPQSKLSKRGSNHVKRQNSKGRVDMNYVLSPDLKAVTVDLLANKYGGKEKANNAARIIQEYYRHWIFSKSFKRMRAYSERRKRSITKPPSKFLEAERHAGRSVVYGLENPVLIVDLQNDSNGHSANAIQQIEEDEIPRRTLSFRQTMDELNANGMQRRLSSAGDEKQKMIMLPADSVFYCGGPNEEKVEKDILFSSSTPINAAKSQNSESNAQCEEKGQTDQKVNSHKPVRRSDSTDSYEIIDEKQVLQVIGRLNDELSAGSHSSVSSGTTEDQEGSHDHHMLSSSIFYDDDRYPPTVDKSRKWRYRIGINLFNSKPEDGIEYLIDNELLIDTSKNIAEFLRKETSISKQKISEYFGNLRKEKNRLVLQEFAASFDFSGKEIDEALRQFQSYFKLTGEAQSIERFLQVFSERYVECNPEGMSTNVDTILLLSFAMAMLNTDLHNGNVKRKMTVEDFINNLRGTDDGKDFPKQLLHDIFDRIQKNEFSTGADHITQLKQIEQSFVGKVPTIAVPQRQFVKLFTLDEIFDQNKVDKRHFRLAFLFNDLLLLAKPRAKTGQHGSGHIFSFKASFKLLGMQIAEFSNDFYKFGVYLQTKMDVKTVGRFNFSDEKSRRSFTEELDDCIRETTGMNNIRIALSKTKQMSRGNFTAPKSMTLDRKTIKAKKPAAETLSLLSVDMNSLEAEDLSKSRASSMLNISEAASDTESEPSMRRSTSSTSLDNSNMSAETKHASLPRYEKSMHRSPTATHRKSLFSFTRRRKHSVEKPVSTTTHERRHQVGLSTFFHEEDDIIESEA